MKRASPAIRISVIRCSPGIRKAGRDIVAVEEPLEIRIGKRRLAVLMRTPGDDADLALGFLLSEGLIQHPNQIAGITHCPNVREPELGNVLIVLPEPGCRITIPDRRFYAGSACGICGKTSIESVSLAVRRMNDTWDLGTSVLASLPQKLHETQVTFSKTGGLHAAGLFDAHGQLVVAREDVGRHNAVDKVIGALAADGRFPLNDLALLVSGRASFEICQKAALAGIPIVASISAPSSLAIKLARRLNQTLVAFLRGGTCSIYAGARRIRPTTA
jgi:FdhD protein